MSKNQKFEFGYQVLTWDLAGHLDDAFPVIAETGFKWFEALFGDSLGEDFARRNMTLGPVGPPPFFNDLRLLQRLATFGRVDQEYGLRLASLYVDGEWINEQLWPIERDIFQANARFLKGFDARFLVCGGGKAAPDGGHLDEEYRAFAHSLEEIGAYTLRLGIRTVYHPHLDTFIQTREELDHLISVLNTDLVGICLDPAHFAVNGDDPVDIARAYIDQIDYFHFKDVKGDVKDLTGYDRYLAFAELGAGGIDLPAMTEIMLQNEFDGLAIVEIDYAEDPDASCHRSAEYITEVLGLKLDLN
jgi:inosose dehydratase